MYGNFTDRAHKVMQCANDEAQRFNHEYIGTEHVLLGLIKEGSGVAANVLKNLDIDLRIVRAEVEKLVQSGPDMITKGRLPQTPRTAKVIEYATEETRHLNHNYVGTEHLLLGLMREQEGVAAQVLLNLGLKLQHIRKDVLNLLGHDLDDVASRPKDTLVRITDSSRLGVLRTLDASVNRASEGLRVVEDYARFVLDDGHLTQLLKQLRHELAQVCAALPLSARHEARETQRDVGVALTTKTEETRGDAWEVCIASSERVKQSLRSLEEYSKVDFPELPAKFEALRYRLYTVERSLGITQDSRSRLRDLQLCVLVAGRDSIDDFRKLTQSLITAGVKMIQLREKGLDDQELIEHARLRVKLLRQIAGDSELVIIINDRPDVAALTDADGVHLGQDDMSVKDARTIVGPRKLIGVSTHSIEQARTAVLDGANYLGAGPTFPSSTKSFAEFPGLEFLKQIAREISLATFAIGGISGKNLQQVLAAGITRVAVSGAILKSVEPGATAKQLLELLQDTAPEPPATADD